MRMLRRTFAVTFGVVIAAWAGPSSGQAATFTQPSVASVQGSTLAEDAYQPVIDGNGDAVVFVGQVAGVQGVWEKSLSGGTVTPVAGQTSSPSTSAPDAGSPSVSASGQYIAFTTTADLDEADDPGKGCSSVYVRNMAIPVGQAGAYTLVSALNGSTQGLTYLGTAAPGGGCPGGGSAAAYKSAISADGNEVAFTIMGDSDLTTNDPSQLTTPPAQVAVRYLNSDTTTLVSQSMASEQPGVSPAPVPNGAAMTDVNDQISVVSEAENGATVRVPVSASTAAISADGSTVAWDGINIPQQAPASSADAPASYPDQFNEPLWRKITDGNAFPTRRITGGDDPSAAGGQGPFDESFDPVATPGSDVGPEYGALMSPANGFGAFDGALTYTTLPLDEATPQLSENGQEVAFLANAFLYGQVPSASSSGSILLGSIDAYVANMADGATRSAALTQLTENQDSAYDVAISPDGTKVVFTTAAASFVLASPALVTQAPTQVSDTQLYEVDLTAGTMSLVSLGYDGNPADGNVEEPSFTADGNTLAFASSAGNLLYGAYNGFTPPSAVSTAATPSTLVFTTTENTSPLVPGQTSIGPGVLPLSLVPEWTMGASASANPDGTATLNLDLPGAGTVTVSGTALVPIAKTKTVKKNVKVLVKVKVKVRERVKPKKSAKPHDRQHSKPLKPKYKLVTKLKTELMTKTKRVKQIVYSDQTRTILTATQTATGAGPLTMTLTPTTMYATQLEAAAGLYTTLNVTFSATGQQTLAQTIQMGLHKTPPAKLATPAKKTSPTKNKTSVGKKPGMEKSPTKPKSSGKAGPAKKAAER